MDGIGPLATRDGRSRTLEERVEAILSAEIANGALANIAAAEQAWSSRRYRGVIPQLTRQFAGEVEELLDTVVDLIASRAPHASSPQPASGAANRTNQVIEPMVVLRAEGPVQPGGKSEIHSGIRNDGPTPAGLSFHWSDLLGEPCGHIDAGCLRVLPGRSRLLPGAYTHLTIDLAVPDDAQPGLYRGLLQANELPGLSATLTFLVANEQRWPQANSR